MRTAYITGTGTCLPGPAIGNDAMETYIGTISPAHRRPDRSAAESS